ncbi:Receptor-like serine/threonine-protein kinase ALE2 [Heracleum sosnowskyi]|uniref:Receptor-like serine/threonine-protein kinase ALE2 n=1 Tax=Heracleum sosnowskyi TaxID=360622 RepID=A0AAD8H2A6_9APIA|nr:Receptor-like serine/threonine-protein kinase ALE2 [Heracleum sosnowskyi]
MQLLIVNSISFLAILFNLPVLGFAGFSIPSLTAGSVLNHLSIPTPRITSYGTTGSSQFSPQKGAPSRHNFRPSHSPSVAPAMPPFHKHAGKLVHYSSPPPLFSYFKHHHARKKFKDLVTRPSNRVHPPTSSQQGLSPSVSPFSPASTPISWDGFSPAPVPVPLIQPVPMLSPTISPASSSVKKKKTSPPSSVMALPPPPPNEECTSVTCTKPFTYTPGGSPCGCVLPIEVRLDLSVELYTFIPLVSELAKEIAVGLSLNQSQVRIIGANEAIEQLEKTMVLINLVPVKENFAPTTALVIYKRFWTRQVAINASHFGTYKVVNVRYPGLPSSPPSAHSSAANIYGDLYPRDGNGRMPLKPLGIDVPRRKKAGTGGSKIAVIVLSSVTAFAVCTGILLILLLKCGWCICRPQSNPHVPIPSQRKVSGTARSLMFGSRHGSASISRSSNALAYKGIAKIFSSSDLMRATDNFDAARILGEGGFGLVYSGILDDRRKVAVKVLKRDDQQGGREFLAEVDMLSRLHHRNLVKLIGICTEDHCRCLVYELVPNDSVESHLHGIDKEIAPLDWCARIKIALGSARGLAYLHEDSSPRVIHRDFKSSNILLEHDFTPKVSDFGLAKSALDEGNKHISTHVMGTFGYLAPEYAMTGHLLVKSDVYSYGVVLLELLTGRKPVDLSQPPGQENLVSWARPLLTDKEALETIIDPYLKPNMQSDSVSKVAAIASMCVQPEVSHRPFMGEVVQALKLVCNEFDEINEDPILENCSYEDFSAGKYSRASSGRVESPGIHYPGYNSILDSHKIPLSNSNSKYPSAELKDQESGSIKRISSSAPLKLLMRGFSKGCSSEHESSGK